MTVETSSVKLQILHFEYTAQYHHAHYRDNYQIVGGQSCDQFVSLRQKKMKNQGEFK